MDSPPDEDLRLAGKKRHQLQREVAHYRAFIIPVFTLSCENQKISSTEDAYTSTFQELEDSIEKPDSLLTQNELIKRDKLFNLVLEKINFRG